MYNINDAVDRVTLRPVAQAYNKVLPEPVRQGVTNFSTNLYVPRSSINSFLQGKPRDGFSEMFRFIINTTFGIGGLFDPAKEHFNQQLQNEDTGQTLGHYGIGHGPYLVLPLLGPSSLRDGIGQVGDSYLDLTWHLWGAHKSNDNYDYVGARIADTINNVALDKDTYEGIKRDALDPYLFMRDAYAQYRRNLTRK